jgi:hypothetical protein
MRIDSSAFLPQRSTENSGVRCMESQEEAAAGGGGGAPTAGIGRSGGDPQDEAGGGAFGGQFVPGVGDGTAPFFGWEVFRRAL